MNYWEPTHYLLYGKGFQTWEYSPAYGIRSYAYIILHALVGFVFKLFGADKITVFYGIRLALAVVCALCELFFYTNILNRFGSKISLFTFIFLLFSPGMWIASTAYLPSSMAMYAMMIALGSWFTGKYAIAVMAIAFAAIIPCWPFAVVAAIPIGLDCIRTKGFGRVFKWGLLSLLYFLPPTLLMDFLFYRKITLPVLNIIMYNVISGEGRGPELYGVAPWTFYFQNLFLNFNFIAILALSSLPAMFIYNAINKPRFKTIFQLAMYMTPMYIWLGLMLLMPHKEERFLYVIYPLICFAAAFALAVIMDAFSTVVGKIAPIGTKIATLQSFTGWIEMIVCIGIILLAMSRIVSLYVNYSAPVHVYTYLNEVELTGENQSTNIPVTVCVGKEWYRFPSNFFLPSKANLEFIQSGFKGQLPKPYSKDTSTWGIPTHMNDLNLEEPSRYVNLSSCHYLVDLDLPYQIEPHYSELPQWEVCTEFPFLDAVNSPSPLHRAFYLGSGSCNRNKFASYQLLRNKAMSRQEKAA